MKKLVSLVSLLLCVVILFSLSASAEDRIQVNIWHTWNVEEGGTEHELKVIVDEYNLSQDKVEVVLISQPYSGFDKKVFTSTANKVGPDVYFNFANTLPEYVEENLVADMGAYLDAETLRSRISETLYGECVGFSDGKLHIVPIQSTVPVIFYNATLYQELGLEAPQTWEDLENNARVIFMAKGIPGFAVDSFVDLGQALFSQTGALYINEADSTVGFNTPACVERLEWFVNCVREGFFTVNYESGSIDQDFNAGLLGSFMGTCSYEPYILPNGFAFGCSALPGTGENKWSPLFSRGAVVLSSDETTEEAACDFIRFFTDQEHAARWSMAIGSLSPYNDASGYEGYDAYIASSIVLQAAIETMQDAHTTPAVIGAQTVRNEMKQAFLQAIGGLKTAEQALADAEVNCNAALQAK